jgi:hypothetical protein
VLFSLFSWCRRGVFLAFFSVVLSSVVGGLTLSFLAVLFFSFHRFSVGDFLRGKGFSNGTCCLFLFDFVFRKLIVSQRDKPNMIEVSRLSESR